MALSFQMKTPPPAISPPLVGMLSSTAYIITYMMSSAVPLPLSTPLRMNVLLGSCCIARAAHILQSHLMRLHSTFLHGTFHAEIYNIF